MHFVLSLFCDGRVVEIFILRLVHLESGIFMIVQVGSTESFVGMASFHFSWLIISLLSANVCGCDLVKSRPVGIVEFDVVNCCREVFIVIPWGSGPGIDIRLLFKSFDGKGCFRDCVDGG